MRTREDDIRYIVEHLGVRMSDAGPEIIGLAEESLKRYRYLDNAVSWMRKVLRP